MNQGRVVKAINTRNEMTRSHSMAPRITELRVWGGEDGIREECTIVLMLQTNKETGRGEECMW